MWICMNNAFLSIVEDPENPDNLLVRARCPGHIEEVFGGHCSPCDWHETPNRDYRFRASFPRHVVSYAVSQRVASIDYPNFKNSVADRDLHGAYAAMWGVMRRLQDMLMTRTRTAGVTFPINRGGRTQR